MAVPTLNEVKQQLNITTSAHDTELTKYLSAALKLIEARIGPSTVRSFTETVTAHSVALNLSWRPVVTVDTLTPLIDHWQSFTSADVEFDARAGSVWRKDHGSLAGRWSVAYTAGWAVFPDNFNLATLVTVQHLWRMQRGTSKRPSMGGADDLQLVAQGTLSLTRQLRGGSITLPAAALALLQDGPYYGGIA